MKVIKQLIIGILLLVPATTKAVGWPSGFEGVMLQGFYWDSYQNETKWYKLEALADELSPYFRLIWLPNGSKSTGGLGYMPIYWFTNHNSDMGSELQLTSMIKKYKSKGTEILTDLVINHRAGAYNWADFPTETWNGQTWKIGMDGICKDDEINNPGNPGGATGANDEGEHFDGARDLDHTNANVQENCKNFCKCLLEKYGYAGYRVDMAKGYSGYYLKMYNQYAKPTYSVGEYWDGSYDALAAWIESTGWESAAFDFAFKYQVNEAFASGDMSKLVWYENGAVAKPAGLIHHYYQQMAVTFIDNHDTYRDDWNKFKGNIPAANAFMICSPGTPCVFLPHWNAYKEEIAKMIEARNAMGISNTSEVRVLRTSADCYMAEVTGSKGKLVVKIGSAWVSPDGYTDSQIHCYGNDYCIWTSKKVESNDNEYLKAYPESLYVIGNIAAGSWQTNGGVKFTKNGTQYTASDVELKADYGSAKAYFSLCTAISDKSGDWTTVNSHDRYGASAKDKAIAVGSKNTVVKYAYYDNAAEAYSWCIEPGTYDITVDLSTMTMTVTNAGEAYVEMPDKLYLMGNLETGDWETDASLELTKGAKGFTAEKVTLVAASGSPYAYFSFATKRSKASNDWTTVNSSARYGAKTKDLLMTVGTPTAMVEFSSNPGSANAWSVTPGTYDITVDFSNYTVTLKNLSTSYVSELDRFDAETEVYYDMMGRIVAAPTKGSLYVVRKGEMVYKKVYR